MRTYIKLYDDILAMDLPLEERVILALIRQMTESGGGFWAGYKAMSERLGINKSTCKAMVKHLEHVDAISITTETIKEKSRLVLRTTSR